VKLVNRTVCVTCEWLDVAFISKQRGFVLSFGTMNHLLDVGIILCFPCFLFVILYSM